MNLIFNSTGISCFIGLVLCFFSFQYGWAETDTAKQIKALEDQLEQLSKQDFGREYAQATFELAGLYFSEEDYVKANHYFRQIKQMDSKVTGGHLAAENQKKIGESYFWQSQYDSAAVSLINALERFPEYFNSIDSAQILQRIGDSYHYLGDLKQAHYFKFQSIDILLRKGKDQNKADAYYSLGEIYSEEDNYPAAIQKLEAALQLYIDLGQIKAISYCEDLLANVYFEMKDFEKSLDYRIRSSDEKYGLTSAYERAYAKHHIGETYVALKEYAKALPLLLEALKIREESKQKEETIITGMALANWQVLQGNCKKGARIFKDYERKAKALGIQPVLQKLYKRRAEAAFKCKDFKTSVIYTNKFIHLKDSLSDAKTKIQVANLGAIYDLKEQNQQIAVLEKEKEVTRLYMILALSVILTLFLAGLAVYWMFYKKSLYSELLEKQNGKIEDQFATISAANNKLEKVNKDLEQFAHIVSHDLKSPLRTIGGYTSLLKRRYSEGFDETGHEFMTFIKDGVEHMENLLDDVLVYSKSKSEEIELEPLPLQPLINKVLFALESTIVDNEAVIIKEFSGIVMGNSTQLFQLLQNLIENALKFIPEERKPIIEIKTKKIGDHIQIEIKDNGIGIKKEHQEKIFEPFKRLHSTTQYKGTGVGLAICQRIVEKHQGKIGLHSDGISGTTFYFTLLDAKEQKRNLNTEKNQVFNDLVYSN